MLTLTASAERKYGWQLYSIRIYAISRYTQIAHIKRNKKKNINRDECYAKYEIKSKYELILVTYLTATECVPNSFSTLLIIELIVIMLLIYDKTLYVSSREWCSYVEVIHCNH